MTIRMRDFTPIYDVLSVAPYREYYNEDLTLCVLETELDAVFSPSYEIAGHYTFECFLTLATNLGLVESASKKLITQLCLDVGKYFKPVLEASSSPDKHIISNHIKEKLSRLGRYID